MCIGAHTSLYCPVLEYNYFSQGCATSEILSLLSLLYTLGTEQDNSRVHSSCKHAYVDLPTFTRWRSNNSREALDRVRLGESVQRHHGGAVSHSVTAQLHTPSLHGVAE